MGWSWISTGMGVCKKLIINIISSLNKKRSYDESKIVYVIIRI